VPQQNQRLAGMLFPSDAAELDHVVHQEWEPAGAEISQAGSGRRAMAMTAVIVAIYSETLR
jgi:hypothetical protein